MMKLKDAYDLGAFGVPCSQLWVILSTIMPQDIIKKAFDKWAEKKTEELKRTIEISENMIEDIRSGLSSEPSDLKYIGEVVA
jgi:hypothetical protein